MKKLKSAIALLLVAVMLFTAACSSESASDSGATADTPAAENNDTGESESSGASTQSPIATEVGTYPVVSEPYTLKVFAQQTPVIEDLTTNEFTLYMEEYTGVTFDWEITPTNALEQNRKISLASNVFPDIYLGANVTKDEEMIYGKAGVFLPLNDIIETQAPNTKDAIDTLNVWANITAPDGNIYSLPTLTDAQHPNYPTKLWINSSWREDLGFEVPTTTDELYDMLLAFKTQDPNGNGQDDEIALFSADAGTGTDFQYYFINSFIQSDLNGFNITDGVISAAFITEGWREALRYMKSLVDAEILDVTSFSATYDQLKTVGETGSDTILGGVIWPYPNDIWDFSVETHTNYDTIPPVAGPEGVQYAPYKNNFVMSGQLVVTNECEYPDVAVRVFDWLYTQEGMLSQRIGREGIEWHVPEDGVLSYTGEDATWQKLTPLGGVQNFFWSQWNVPSYNRHEEQASNQDMDVYASNGLEIRLYEATVDNYVPYTPEEYLPELHMNPDTITETVQNKTNIDKFVDESLVRFVTGDLSIDDDWDKYVEDVTNMELDMVIAEYQTAYDSFLANSK